MRAGAVFNERAWGIEIISEINRLLSCELAGHPARQAGGEYGTPKAGESTLFPDVLLFGDAKERLILQGWELKMPDTAADDAALLANAAEKAERMGTGSFLVWNGRSAVLHAASGDGHWKEVARWTNPELDSRGALAQNPGIWKKTLRAILEYLAGFFTRGGGRARLDVQGQLDFVLERVLAALREPVAAELKRLYAGSRSFRTSVDSWWLDVCGEHPETSGNGQEAALEVKTEEIACYWAIRVLFAHYMKTAAKEAWGIDRFGPGSLQQEAKAFFNALSEKHDYAHLLHSREDLPPLSDDAWRVVTEFNEMLARVRLAEITPTALHGMLRQLGEKDRRKAFGQFATPRRLADLLVRFVLDDAENDVVLDPCCGTGTLARASMDARMRMGVSETRCLQTTWASDRFRGPLPFATLAMSSAGTAKEVVRVFQSDVLGLACGKSVAFRDPRTGKERTEGMPKFTAILSNPPFIRFEHWRDNYSGDSLVAERAVALAKNLRSDFLVPVVLHLAELLKPCGTIGLVLPNAWLGTDWARTFRNELIRRFWIRDVVGSMAGRWFGEAKVVANLVVLQKKGGEEEGSGAIRFSLTQKHLSEWSEDDTERIAARIMGAQRDCADTQVSVCRQSTETMAVLDEMGLSWTAAFVPLDWLDEMRAKLVPVNRHFDIARGERRGWDALFYPGEESARGIETEFLAPVVKTAATVETLVAHPDGSAFCCDVPIDELRRSGRNGALAWINRFEREYNGTGRPLPEVLARANRQWYEMSADTKADLAVSMNPGERLFFMRMEEPTFVNQRLIRLTRKPGAPDLTLCQALLCSLAGCFFLEALGFGRGEGVLDLNASKLRNGLPMWNPEIISSSSAAIILKAFHRLEARPVKTFTEECRSTDRQAFERTVLDAVGCSHLHGKLLNAVSRLHNIRLAPVKDR